MNHYPTELFAYVNPMQVCIPPLRSRPEDITVLMDFFDRGPRQGSIASRLTEEALALVRSHHWPANVSELLEVTDYLRRSRPSGPIRVSDMPEGLRDVHAERDGLTGKLAEIQREAGFRLLGSEEKLQALARFLRYHRETTFTPLDVQRGFGQGRETVRRLLARLRERGVIEGITGARGMRITQYRTVPESTRAPEDSGPESAK